MSKVQIEDHNMQNKSNSLEFTPKKITEGFLQPYPSSNSGAYDETAVKGQKLNPKLKFLEETQIYQSNMLGDSWQPELQPR